MTQSYDSAIAYFNQNASCSMDDLHYTYDSEENVLIKHYKNAAKEEDEAKSSAAYLGIATLFAASSSYEAIQKDDWAAHGPDWSLAFMAVYACSALMHLSSHKSTVKTVKCNVETDRQRQDTPIL
tara:strand:- start:33639 stop:34013 length:375 start_codon:yes stop_codon:yes gene_type:complete